jgi:uncharacterized protein YndB with AHSA1/START domain
MSKPTVTGRRETRDGWECIVLERTFRAPVQDVWEAATDPERMERWIGTWEGDPTSGSVQFRMTAEGDDIETRPWDVLRCEPPRRLVVASKAPYDGDDLVDWKVELTLTETDGVTTLTFVQGLPEPRMAENVAPGWEYYLDRLVVAHGGGDMGTVVWDEYYPWMSEPYARMFGTFDE